MVGHRVGVGQRRLRAVRVCGADQRPAPKAAREDRMKIGILTGGGDVPGLNPCIKAVVNRAATAGIEVVGIRRGWGGLLNYNLDDESDREQWVQPLTPGHVRTIDRYGGTHLHT